MTQETLKTARHIAIGILEEFQNDCLIRADNGHDCTSLESHDIIYYVINEADNYEINYTEITPLVKDYIEIFIKSPEYGFTETSVEIGINYEHCSTIIINAKWD